MQLLSTNFSISIVIASGSRGYKLRATPSAVTTLISE
jgi:hypothetical protein